MYLLPRFLTNLCRQTPKQMSPHWTRRSQTTDTLHEQSVDSRRQAVFLLSYSATRAISHWFPIFSLTSHLSGSQWCSLLKQIWFPTFVHLSFLTGLSKIALIPFTWENSDLHSQPPWRGKTFLSTASSKCPLGWHGNAVSHLHKVTTTIMFLNEQGNRRNFWLEERWLQYFVSNTVLS